MSGQALMINSRSINSSRDDFGLQLDPRGEGGYLQIETA